jgi:hypothetical protein
MSRCTQFVGLTCKAQKFVETLTYLGSPNRTFGMFEELIPLQQFVDDKGTIYEEFEQAAPWSSGPMIFTALRIKNDQGWTIVHGWTQDRNCVGQYDGQLGLYWV